MDHTPSPSLVAAGVTTPSVHHDDQEVLATSPPHGFADLACLDMPRSVSASSSFDATTPYTSSAYYSARTSPSATPDWAAMQLAQSYIPSLSPVILSPSPFNASALPIPRTTPSPLPTLGELGALSRSNSAAARAKAMSKLTGAKGPADEAVPRVRLQRSGTVGAPRLTPLAANPATPPRIEEAVLQPRPRLQRSLTVSSSNMDEERRSAVGRRMVERLAERKAARQREESEVRQLWEERRAQADTAHQFDDAEDEPEVDVDANPGHDPHDTRGTPTPVVPVHVQESSPVEPDIASLPSPAYGTLPIHDRAASRNTERSERSGDDAFEYEAHLRRSLSSRTARNEFAEAQGRPRPSLDHTVEQLHIEDDLPPPAPAFATPSRHAHQPSTSSQTTIQAVPSPGASSVSGDGLTSSMFALGNPLHDGISGSPGGGKWSTEVGENGSDWGTPNKQDMGFHEPLHAVGEYDMESSGFGSRSPEFNPRSPAFDSRTQSVMSWEEVGGADDHDIPSDPRYLPKSGSVSVKMGRVVKEAMRKRTNRSGSVSSSVGSPPTSPRQLVTAVFTRRESQSSTSPGPRHQPSVSSMSPSISADAASANSILLQHQLSSDPSPVSFLPRADLNDPRVHNSKLSPFPGIAVLEQQQNRGMEAPPLLHQLSDSAVPSQQRVQPAEPIYSLPPPTANATPRRESADSMGKRSWLAKAFGQSTRSSLSTSLSRSNSDQGYDGSPDRDSDPFAPPPIPSRPAPIPEEHRIPPKSLDVLSRMDEVLALQPDDPARPEMLDDPPRKLLLATQVLQVVNVHTVKDRFLLLFNDILVIAKPIIMQGTVATLDLKFVVKSIVALDKLVVSGIANESAVEPPRHPVVASFIAQFTEDPVAAVRYLVERSNPRVDVLTVASLIFKTPELDKAQIGNLLAGNSAVLCAFVGRFQFAGARIDDALRMFLLALRLPRQMAAAESLLQGFADGYHSSNKDIITRNLCIDLVMAMLELNDMLYSTFGFAAPSPSVRFDDFVASFREKDQQHRVDVDLLHAIFNSIAESRLVEGLACDQADRAEDISLTPARLPSKITYQTFSESIVVRIAKPDPHLQIRLLGTGLEFDPPVLDFTRTAEQSFRIKGNALGVKSLLFQRVGANAALYASIGNTRTFSVEPAFMQHTFHVAFISHLGLKRKYCFSVPDAATRSKWANALVRGIRTIKDAKAAAGPDTSLAPRIRQAAEAVSLQVLRDALIAPDERAAAGNGTMTPSKRNPNTRLQRSGSVSVTYQPAGTDKEPPSAQAAQEVQGRLLDVQTGKELVLVCRQNSLMPGLLELLQAGVNRPDDRAAGLRARLQGVRV
ncbi:hypothetical protein Q5752_002527 [Cryptotrichosporon argae]